MNKDDAMRGEERCVRVKKRGVSCEKLVEKRLEKPALVADKIG